MKYYSQLEVEKMFEILYSIQCDSVPSGYETICPPILETKDILMTLQESNFDDIKQEFGNIKRKRCNQCNLDCKAKKI